MKNYDGTKIVKSLNLSRIQFLDIRDADSFYIWANHKLNTEGEDYLTKNRRWII